MEAYETEEQQVEAIKKWWQDNYKMVVAALVLGLGSILGVQFYQQNQQMMAEDASNNYAAVLNASTSAVAGDEQKDTVAGRAEILQKQYQSSPYSSQATLLYAKVLADKGDLDGAISQLDWVISNNQDATMEQIAKIQKAQLLAASDKSDAAISLLNGLSDQSSGFKAISLEVKGDILAQQGKKEEAKKAYDDAIAGKLLAGGNVEILQIKRNDLGK